MKLDRRNFLKAGAAVSGALSIGGIAAAGFASGLSPASYTGWGKNNLGKDQFFNREPFYTDEPVHNVIGATRRIEYIEDIFKRNNELYKLLYARNPGKK